MLIGKAQDEHGYDGSSAPNPDTLMMRENATQRTRKNPGPIQKHRPVRIFEPEKMGQRAERFHEDYPRVNEINRGGG